MQSRYRKWLELLTDDSSGSDKMRVRRNINARFWNFSDRKRFIKLLVGAGLAYYTLFNYWHNLHYHLAAYLYLTTPPSSPVDTKANQSSHYAKFGEVSEEMLGLIPTGIDVMPTDSTWNNSKWMHRMSILHGNHPKRICQLFDKNQPIRSQPLSESSLPYRVLVRPIELDKRDEGNKKSVGDEFLAYNVAQELGIHKIPTQTIIASGSYLGEIPVNIQSLLRGIHMTFIDEWQNCLPDTMAIDDSFSTKPPSRGSNNSVVLDIGKGDKTNETKTIRLNFIHANTTAIWKLCFRNATHFSEEWGQYCLNHQPLIRKCRQEEIAQLLEMAMFDAIISNQDRIRGMKDKSNNIHWLWPPAEGDGNRPSVNTQDPLQLVWIDHAHHSFRNIHSSGGLVTNLFSEVCVFPDSLLQKLFDPTARSDHRSLSERVLERLMPKLLATFNGTERLQSTEERAQTVAQKLKVVDVQLDRLRAVVTKCARKHNPPGAVDVMEVLDLHGNR